jgi:hypothetical protein
VPGYSASFERAGESAATPTRMGCTEKGMVTIAPAGLRCTLITCVDSEQMQQLDQQTHMCNFTAIKSCLKQQKCDARTQAKVLTRAEKHTTQCCIQQYLLTACCVHLIYVADHNDLKTPLHYIEYIPRTLTRMLLQNIHQDLNNTVHKSLIPSK